MRGKKKARKKSTESAMLLRVLLAHGLRKKLIKLPKEDL
jgi:hypothetical protein